MLIPQAPSVADMAEGFSPVKEATYFLRVDKAEYVPKPRGANAKGNPYVNATLIITGAPGVPDCPETGRRVFQNYMLTGEGSYRLRDLLESTGHPPDFQLTDTDQLLNLEFKASVIVEKGKDGNPDKNQIRKHMPLQDPVPA